MPKRKRPNYEGTGDRGDRVRSMRTQDIQDQLIQSKKLLHRALKLAKSFERQKLGKRLKNATAESKSDDVARINREIEALSSMDLERTTEAHLHKTLLKIKRIAESELLPEEVRKVAPKPDMSEEMIAATNNVLSGMLNMPAVKTVIPQLVTGMHIAMGIPQSTVVGKKKPGKKEEIKGILKKTSLGVSRRETSYNDDTGSDKEQKQAKRTAKGVRFPQEDLAGSDDEDEDISDDDMLARYDAQLGGSSDEDSFNEEEFATERKAAQPGQRHSLSLSPSASDSDGEIIHSKSFGPKTKRERASKPKAPISTPKGSTFLPSLSAGYWSGSESSASDFDDAPPPAKKNRPGQMARRAIAEKKHGKGANHIKKGLPPVAEMGKRSKHDGWDPKRGATGGERGGRGGRRGGRGGKQRDFSQVMGENAIAVVPRKVEKKRDDVGVLHPSWQAAKKAKEEKKTATFEGKKVTFD